MAGYRNTKVRMPKNPFGSPKRILKRGIYEIVSAATGGNTKPRDYSKKINGGR